MDKQTCQYCGGVFASLDWLEKHFQECPKKPSKGRKGPDVKRTKKLKLTKKLKVKRRPPIGGKMRKRVWDTYIGQRTEAKCFCCRERRITPFTSCDTFHAGHIISHKNGGKVVLDNLLPICKDCNMRMSDWNWDAYIGANDHLSLRVYGANPPERVVWAVIIIQSLARMYLERKNLNSEWRLQWVQRHFGINALQWDLSHFVYGEN